MKKILLIIFLLISLFCKSQYAWFQSYPTAVELPAIQLLTFGNGSALNSYCFGYATGNVTYTGNIIERGFVVNTSGNPTTSDTKIVASGSGSGTFSGNIDFAANTTYYCRAYVIYGTSIVLYSNQINYTSNAGETVATNGNSTPVCGTSCSFTVYGLITTNGTVPNTNGFNWGETPSVINYQAVNSSSASFSYDFTFDSGRTIYYQAVAFDQCDGMRYGSIQSVYLPSGCSVPTVVTSAVSNITSASAISGGNITNDGGCPVTARGVQWSQNSDFSTILGTTSDGSGVGSFSSSITGLKCGTTYYLRSYATNINSTAYGSTVNFTTTSNPSFTNRTFYYMAVSSGCGSANLNTLNTYSEAVNLCHILSSCSPYQTVANTSIPMESVEIGKRAFVGSNSCDAAYISTYRVYSDGSLWYILYFDFNGYLSQKEICN